MGEAPDDADAMRLIIETHNMEKVELRMRIHKLETALCKIIDGPADKGFTHESGCPFERFACAIAREALRNPEKG